MTLSPSVCCGFTSSFKQLSGISLFFPTWKSTAYLVLFFSHGWWRSVLLSHQISFSFFLFHVVFAVQCSSQLVVLAPVPWFLSFLAMWVHLVLTVFLCHRRIDVSPRAFKKHSQLFEAVKSSEDGTYKVTENFAVWSMLEKQTAENEWASQMPLDCTLFKACGFPWREMHKV